MPISKQLLNALVQDTTEATTPNQYAKIAAHRIAVAKAELYIDDAAATNSAACIAAMSQSLQSEENANYARQLAIEKINSQRANTNYNHLLNCNSRFGYAPLISYLNTNRNIEFMPIATKIHSALNDYTQNFPQKEATEALDAAWKIYPYAYACLYASFIRATALAKISQDKDRQFKYHMEFALSHYLGENIIDPSLWVTCMSSQTLYILIIMSLLVATVGIALGSCGLALPVVSASLASVGINSIILTAIAASILLLDLIVYGVRYQTQQNFAQCNLAGIHEIEGLNNLSFR